MRTYERTHPWLTFELDLNGLAATPWMLLGEARSKCEHLAGVPLRPSTAEELNRIYLVKGVLATTAIEGNTLSEDQVRKHLDGKLVLPPSKQYLAVEIDNILKASNGIWAEVLRGQPFEVTPEKIKALNRDVLAGLAVDAEVVPGELRKHSVGVATYRGAPAEDLEFLIDKLCTWLSSTGFNPNGEYGIVPALLAAMMAHLYLAWIHPFGDGNGRTARLLEYAILVSAGVPMPAAHLLSNHYNETRTAYYRELDYASKSKGDVKQFIRYAAQGFVDGLKDQIDIIRKQQLDVAWENYVHSFFGDRRTETSKRRCRLLLTLSSQTGTVPLRSLHLLPPVAAAYQNRKMRTFYRDVRELLKEGLVLVEGEGIRAKKELIEAFLPPRRTIPATTQLPLEFREEEVRKTAAEVTTAVAR